MKRLACLLLTVAFALPLAAQHDHCGGMIGWVPKEILERPTTIKQGVGTLSDPVSTSSKEAQSFYNQGIAYLHSYVWIEASRSFHQALRLDPKLAMAHIGLARTYVNLSNLDEAQASLKRAQELSANISPREKVRIDVMAKHLEALADASNKSKHLAYKVFLDKSLAAFPQDAEMWILRGNAEEATAYGRGQRGGIASIAFYEAALNRSPAHWGANHYLIHSNEFIGQINDALRHGKIYAEAAPAIPHAQHMYAHDLRRNGNIEEAIARFRAANELENTYYKVENIDRQYDWHHTHNLSLLATSYQYQGKAKLTEGLLKDAISVPVINAYQEFYHKDYTEFLLNRRRYSDALTAARHLANGKFPMARAIGYVLAGNALLGINAKDFKSAEQELRLAETELKQVSADASFVEPYIDALRAELLLRSGKAGEARPIFQDVQQRIRAIPGPDAWMQAIYRLELIARIARENNDWQLAEYTARQMLDHDPHYGGSHYAMGLIEEHKGNHATANDWMAKAKRAWSAADPGFLDARLQNVKESSAPAGASLLPPKSDADLTVTEMKFDPAIMS
ncbi:MAG TPA: tetratricopeptide repeat protein [Terriglobales bacterium]|nr:tetratricopeptide repeat protein [Terriglobales bacterium]